MAGEPARERRAAADRNRATKIRIRESPGKDGTFCPGFAPRARCFLQDTFVFSIIYPIFNFPV
jgi:hypothetical protein